MEKGLVRCRQDPVLSSWIAESVEITVNIHWNKVSCAAARRSHVFPALENLHLIIAVIVREFMMLHHHLMIIVFLLILLLIILLFFNISINHRNHWKLTDL